MLTVIHIDDPDRLLEKAARHICEKIRETLAVRTHVNIAVPGGRNVAKIFQTMQEAPVDWRQVHFFIVDERLVTIDHPESNYKLLKDHFIDPLIRADRISPDNAHPFILDMTRPDRGCGRYERVLAEHGFQFDIIVLSSGEDGHVGALYPKHHSIRNMHHGFIVMADSPKPPPDRMTASLSLMQTAAHAVLLFVGEAKRDALIRFNNMASPIEDCPAKLVLAVHDATVFTDLKGCSS
ncbi:MAG: 6-phosphogluconolactonase [Desulfatirhabdiaceae bacterium]